MKWMKVDLKASGVDGLVSFHPHITPHKKRTWVQGLVPALRKFH